MNIISAAFSSSPVTVIPTIRDASPAARSRPGARTSSRNAQQLTPEQQREVRRLKRVDRKVRAHERAHMAAGGQYVRGGANFEYTTGPDGNRYAVGGDVSIDTSPVRGDPRATIRKMQTVRSAALAPAEPSAQDRRVASQATKQEMQARKELSNGTTEAPAAADTAGEPAPSPAGYTGAGTPVYGTQYGGTQAFSQGMHFDTIV